VGGRATVQRYAAGDVMVGQGECVRGLELLLEGTARSVIRDGDRRKPVALQEAPTWMSAISALVGVPTEVTVEAVTDCTTGLIETEDWFFTTRGVGEGAGLGQRAARQIVKGDDGGIAIESRPGLTYRHGLAARTVLTPRAPHGRGRVRARTRASAMSSASVSG
jgi:Cyclic nucleotide-binding domain